LRRSKPPRYAKSACRIIFGKSTDNLADRIRLRSIAAR
jgi:hypothetical protein